MKHRYPTILALLLILISLVACAPRYTVATIPVVLCDNEASVDYNCEILEGGIKLPIRNGCIFSFPGKDYPEDVLAVMEAIVFDKEIPENPFK